MYHILTNTLESGINVLLRLLIFGIFSRGYGLIMDLCIRLETLLRKFAHFKGLRLFFLSNFAEGTFIQGGMSILDSIVLTIIWIQIRLQTDFGLSLKGGLEDRSDVEFLS